MIRGSDASGGSVSRAARDLRTTQIAGFGRVTRRRAAETGVLIMVDLLIDEVRGADLGDERLNHRLVRIVERLGQAPNLSIPAATTSRAEMEAAYRFFSNDNVSSEKILAPHAAQTLERMAAQSVVVLVQDTTEIDLTRPSQPVRGAGPMDCESRRGEFFHPLIAFNPEGTPLGILWHKLWARDSIETEATRNDKNQKRKHMPIEDKESIRRLEGLRAARKAAAACPQTTCICVSDSESDIYEFLSEPRSEPANPDAFEEDRPRAVHLLVRACHDRSTETGGLLETVRKERDLFKCSLHLSSRKAKTKATKGRRQVSRDSRTAEVEIRAARVTLKPPWRPDRKLPDISINVVLVEEQNPPAGTDAVQWLLLTTLPIDSVEQVQQIIEYYCLRWQIEVYFRTLKSGCRVEERQFETLSRIQNSLAVYTMVAWRVMYLCCLGRECPDLSCEVVFTPSEWKSVSRVKHRRKPLPLTPPRLNEMIRLIASLGGYVIRPKTHPGTQTLWTGLQQTHFLAMAWDAFGPDS